jgi:gamma-butyrobetaine dioxygenase
MKRRLETPSQSLGSSTSVNLSNLTFSQKQHALQSARQAEQEGAAQPPIVAALLHGIGHLVNGMGEDIAGRGVDARHEDAGEGWLARYFPPEVTESVKLHVAAKRYLCRIDRAYQDQLSPASLHGLALQDGPFTEEEAQEFEEHRYHPEAVRLRRWDDRTKPRAS